MRKILLLCTVLIFSVFASSAFAVCDAVNISNNPDHDYDPQINADGYVVWYGHDGNDYEIMLYDGSTATPITENDYTDEYPQINANGHVVWEGYSSIEKKMNPAGSGPEFGSFPSNWDIFLYDGTSTTQITNSKYNESDPQINANGNIVWQVYDGGDNEIALYNNSTTTPITDNDYNDYDPQINANGHVTWYGEISTSRREGEVFTTIEEDYEILLYDGTTTKQLTNNSHDDNEPQINDNGYVVWYGGDKADPKRSASRIEVGGPNNEIFLYNGNTTEQLTDNSYYDGAPQINTSGHVVWVRGTASDTNKEIESDTELMLYNGITTTQITDNSYDDFAPQINAAGHVVWQGYEGDADSEIFFYDGTAITQLTDNTINDIDPQINADGVVTWRGDTGTSQRARSLEMGWEIFLMTTTEICNGEDDDCDGETDEGLGQTMCGTGICAATVDNCVEGAPQVCMPGTPGTETCNNVDDDCNGEIDEGLTRDTACGLGACASTGAETCSTGSWGNNTCTPGTPGTETCNNIDDDCDGQTDEGLDSTTTCGIGLCSGNNGAIICIDGVMQESTCDPLAGAATEICNDGVDNDCDGETDESCGDFGLGSKQFGGDGLGNGATCFINSSIN